MSETSEQLKLNIKHTENPKQSQHVQLKLRIWHQSPVDFLIITEGFHLGRISCIRLTSREDHGVGNHQQIDRLLNSLLVITTKKSWKIRIIVHCWVESIDFHHKEPVMRKEVPCYDVTMGLFSFRLYGSYCSLAAGHTADALVDFTGGVAEQLDMKDFDHNDLERKEKFFMDVMAAADQSALIVCHIWVITIPSSS